MSYFNQNDNVTYSSPISAPGIEINRIMKFVYVWMGFGLLTTAVVAWVVATNDSLLSLSAQPGVGIITFIALIGIAIGMSIGLNKSWMTPNVAAGMFFGFAAVMGFSLSLTLFAFLSPTVVNSAGVVVPNSMYDPGALYGAFGTAAGLFGAMTIVGFTTNMDLTKMGTYLFMGLIGLVIAMVINMFIGSSTLGFLISIAGVVIFTALTAYDTQKIKQLSMNPEIQANGDLAAKVSILGALTLYLDFINLFLFLLRIFAGGRD
ncbi:MAG: Bax inhibitor-1/YccA family protein [Aggregatilineales bacterium]